MATGVPQFAPMSGIQTGFSQAQPQIDGKYKAFLYVIPRADHSGPR